MLALPTPSTRNLQHIYQVQLGKFLHEGDFVPEVKEALFSFVSGSIAIYYRRCNEMLPTPTKIHYTFNIRDLSQVYTYVPRYLAAYIMTINTCDRQQQVFSFFGGLDLLLYSK